MRASRKGDALAQLLYNEGIRSQAVLNAIAGTPRESFLPDALKHKAYQNTALPIGQGQTISQPYIVAKMTELLLDSPNKPEKVLEIGTGSGYQTAILAQLFAKVFSVERIKSLQFQAKRRMNQLDLHNIAMKHGDGWKGWASKGPYDAIIVNADMTIVAQAPKMAPHIAAMREMIAQDCNVSLDDINVKATTTEKLGYTGRKEGIASHAVVLLEKL